MTGRELIAALEALGPEFLDGEVSLAGDEYKLETVRAGHDWNGPWIDLTTEYRERHECAEDPAQWEGADPATAELVREWAKTMWAKLPAEATSGKFLKP